MTQTSTGARVPPSATTALPPDLAADPFRRAHPAPFWHRYAAWSLDLALCGTPALLLAWWLMHAAIVDAQRQYDALLLLAAQRLVEALQADVPITAIAAGWLADPQLAASAADVQHAIIAVTWPLVLALVLASGLSHAIFESHGRGATPGQQALGLRVSDPDGARIGTARALARHAAGALSWITLNIGHAVALVPPARLALHDRVSGTRVVHDVTGSGSRLPLWAMAWIGAQALLLLWITLAFTVSSRNALEAGLGLDQTASRSPASASGSAQMSRHMKYITPNITTYSTSTISR